MLISELIEELQKIEDEHGNVQVCIEHADAGGSYYTAGDVDIFFDKRNLVYLSPIRIFDDTLDSYPVLKSKKQQEELRINFYANLEAWQEDTQFNSTGILESQYFQNIVDMGKDVIPLIVKELRGKDTFKYNILLVHALERICPDIVQYNGFVSLEEARKTWINILDNKENKNG